MKSSILKRTQNKNTSAFTIVELLIVIVIIGILAAITIVSYRGITQRSVEASLQADLSNASKKLKLFQVDHDLFPTTIDCAIADSNTNLCLKPSSNNVFTYTYDNTANPPTFSLKETNQSGTIAYNVTSSQPPALYNIVVGAPSSFASVGGSGQSVLTWVAPSSTSSITNYKIFRSTTSGSETLLTTVGNVLTYTDTGLAAGTTYYYKILAVNADGDGDQSSEVSSMPMLTFNNTSTGYIGTIQNWIVPVTGTYTIEADGAQGGYGDDTAVGNTRPGYGARMVGSFNLTAGSNLKILVGQAGSPMTEPGGGSRAGGGGGGSFVTLSDNTPLLVASGGAGESWASFNTNSADGIVSNFGNIGGVTNGRGGGGGGLSNNGFASGSEVGGSSFVNGGNGGTGSNGVGGFGGGGGALYEGGGGGGYSGGFVVTTNAYDSSAQAAGSYNSGASQSNTAGSRIGHGIVMIRK